MYNHQLIVLFIDPDDKTVESIIIVLNLYYRICIISAIAGMSNICVGLGVRPIIFTMDTSLRGAFCDINEPTSLKVCGQGRRAYGTKFNLSI